MAAVSPHQRLAETLKVAIAAWVSLPSGFTVERVYSSEQYVGGWADAAAGRILVQVSASDSKRGRKADDDDVTIAVIYLAKLNGIGQAELDTHDGQANALRDLLRQQNVLDIGSLQGAGRISTLLPTPYAAELVRKGEIFAAVIATTYRINVPW